MRVQSELASTGFALKVYDCYRPRRAVSAMAQWANDGNTDGASKRFFPRLPKRTLFTSGYIALYSAHSTGDAVDLTLIRASAAAAVAFDPAAEYGPCTGPAGQRSPDKSVDMGTGFDCFDVNSHTASSAITAEQRQLRTVLVTAMAKYGFKNYRREWWHFSYARRAGGLTYDFPIRPRPAKLPP